MKVKLFLIFFILVSIRFAAADAQERYSALLSQYVNQGKVKYVVLCKDARLNEYISHLTSSDPERLTNDQQRLAFWINAYNAYTLKAICDHYPVKSINDLNKGGLVLGTILHSTIWDKDFVIINSKAMTLNQIEHKIIRPQFKDPRAHFALVCASKSCPPLRPEAFDGSKLDQQLNDQARVFLSDTTRNEFDLKNQTASISKIFDWYAKDFGKNEDEILLYLSKFLSADTAASIRSDPKKWRVEYKDYDWSLNE